MSVVPRVKRTPALIRSAGLFAAAALAVSAFVAPAASASTTTEETPNVTTAVYVEVNSNDMANVAKYTLEGTNRPTFDIAMIFAANINWDDEAQKPYLHLNERVTETLADAENQIRPLQAQGTKVLLSILGNHDPIGLASMTREQADAFAKEVAAVVEQYGLDGVDLDDEWSKYGAAENAPEANGYSLVTLVQSLRTYMGEDKTIALYKIGPSANTLEWEGVQAGEFIDYAWNPWYGSFITPTVPGMDMSQYSAAAMALRSFPVEMAVADAQKTIDTGHGAYMMYDLDAIDRSAYLSEVTQILKGLPTVYEAAPVVEDTTGPAITVNSDASTKRSNGTPYTQLSVTADDASAIASYTLNGVETIVESGTTITLDDLRAGSGAAHLGRNSLDVTDAAGNTSTFSFVLQPAR